MDVFIISVMKILYHPKKVNLANVKLGLLYNWYAATDTRNIAPEGWHVPSNLEFNVLSAYLGGDSISGGKLKEMELIYWNDPNVGADNSSGFTARGTGTRAGAFNGIGGFCWFCAIDEWDIYGYITKLEQISANFLTNGWVCEKFYGNPIRLIMDGVNPSDPGTVTGNNGKIYKTMKIGDQVWMAENLKETSYRTGNIIPEVTNQNDWIALTTGALCAYDNDWNNV
jgi:uncharacterized protein (TIGR02145 family)